MKTGIGPAAQIHSLEAQLRDCRELLNQTNQELAALGNHASALAEALESIKKIAEYPPQDKLILSKATEALTNYRSAKQ